MEKKLIIRAFTVSKSLGFVQAFLPGLMEKYTVKLLFSPEEPVKTISDRVNAEIIPVRMNRRFSPLKDLVSLWAIVRVFNNEHPYMVHSMTPKAGLLCMMAARITKVPVRVHTFTGLVFPTSSGLRRIILKFTDRITCACATHIIPEGSGVKNDLLFYGITKKPLRVLGYGNVRGVDLDYYSRREEVMDLAKQIKKDVFTFVFVGRIVKDKGINELCEAFNKLTEVANARLLLVGPYEDDIDPISNQSKVFIDNNPDIESVGAKFGDELLAYYAASDCFVFPSYREGFPNTVLEAGAMGLPSIVTDINGSREIIREGENGLIVPSRDSNALYEAMLRMISDQESRYVMSSNSRIMIANRYEQSFVRKCLFDFYDEILAPYV